MKIRYKNYNSPQILLAPNFTQHENQRQENKRQAH